MCLQSSSTGVQEPWLVQWACAQQGRVMPQAAIEAAAAALTAGQLFWIFGNEIHN
jgi:hypothetical protein